MDEMVFWAPRGTEQFAMTRFCDGVLMGPKRSSRHKTKHLKKDRRRQLQRRVIQTHAAPDALYVHPHASMSSSSRASTTREPHLECSCVVAVDSLWTRGVCLKWGVRRAQNKRGPGGSGVVLCLRDERASFSCALPRKNARGALCLGTARWVCLTHLQIAF